MEETIKEIFEKALAFGGTLPGEHGIELAKSGFLKNEIGAGAILFSKNIKSALDPKNTLNTGKIIGE